MSCKSGMSFQDFAPSSLKLKIFLTILFAAVPSQSQTPPRGTSSYPLPQERITSVIDDEQRITLPNNRHPLAIAQNDLGAVAPEYPMQRMLLVLSPDPSQEESLNQFVQSQYDPESSNYHHWLTPEEYAERFGISEGDIFQITGWLKEHGFEVEEVAAGRRSIVFSGNAAQVQQAFHTEIHSYRIGDSIHHGNAGNPEIPVALANVVGGIVSLHDFHSSPLHAFVRKASPLFTSGGSHYLAPADFATIYDVNPAYQDSINGNGQSVAIVARSNIKISDITQFRSYFGLPANNPQVIVNGTDPGIWSSDEETEADLDAEWSGAAARNANIKFVVSQSTNSTDGIDLSAQYIVNHNVAPVMSTSFGLCENWLGASGNNFFNSLWEQAAVEGISVFVSSGDNGAAGCDSSSSLQATHGRGVNGICSTPYSVCVGGTEFNDTASPSLYWLSSNASGTQGSALSYIPEVVWNESSPSSGLWASGGGASTLYSKPSWQSGTGVPTDGKRDVPDVSLTAAGHDGYLIVQEGGLYVVGGTSAASPSFAGLMALVVQSSGARQGNANVILYPLASKQSSGGALVFHDITVGNNSVPGQTGFNATRGYDQATGLGSVDASVLVNHWSDGVIVPGFHATAPASTLAVIAGSNNTMTLNVAVSGGFNAAVTFSASGLPAGVTAAFSPAMLSAPGSGSSTLKFTASTAAKAGVYSVTVTAGSGSSKQAIPLSMTVEPSPTFTFSTSTSTVSAAAGNSGGLTLTTTPNSSFNSAITLSASGLPSGVSAQFAPSSLVAAPGVATTSVTFSVGSNVASRAHSISLAATGGEVTQRNSVTLNVPGFSLTASAKLATATSASNGSIKFTTVAVAGFNNPVVLSISGLPSHITGSFSPSTISAPGSGFSTLTLTKGAGASTGTSHVTVTASGGSINQSCAFTLTVK